MPSFPPHGADITREEALTMIIACIAMEELSLSHILNAGGEHLQFVLGTLTGTNLRDILAAHKSITSLVEAVTENQLLLKKKLDQVLEFCPRPAPLPLPPPHDPEPTPKPPSYPSFPSFPSLPLHPPAHRPPLPHTVPHRVPPRQKSALLLITQRAKLPWRPGCRLPWRPRSRSGEDIRWNRHAPAQICLSPGRTYAVHYTLSVCAMAPAAGTGAVDLCQSPCGSFTDTPPLCFPLEPLTEGPQTLQHTALLQPCANDGGPIRLSLVLDAQTPLCVGWAIIGIAEL